MNFRTPGRFITKFAPFITFLIRTVHQIISFKNFNLIFEF